MDYIFFTTLIILIFIILSLYMNKRTRISTNLKDVQMVDSLFFILVPILIFIVICSCLTIGYFFVNYKSTIQMNKMQSELLTSAETYSLELNGMRHDLVTYEKSGQYRFMKERISAWEKLHPNLTNIFTIRKLPNGTYYFVLTPKDKKEGSASIHYGTVYLSHEKEIDMAFAGDEAITKSPIKDVLGNNMVAFVPVYSKNGDVDAVLAATMNADLWSHSIRTERVQAIVILTIILLSIYLIYWLMFRIRLEEIKMKKLAFTDELTELPNRRYLKEYFMKNTKKGNTYIPFLLIDIDRFQTINDSLGHLVGDKVLQQVGNRLVCCIQSNGVVSRISGDEYIVLLNKIENKEDLIDLIQIITTTVQKPITIDTHEIMMTISIGITIYPIHGQDYETLWKNSDLAISNTKTEGGNGYTYFSEKLGVSLTKNLIIENDLRKALSQKQLKLYYQPRVDAKSGELNGAEALLRWIHPTHGFISPTEFIPMAEETGLIIPIGEWVIREVCNQIKEWNRKGLASIPISVNLSAKQFQQKDFITTLVKILQQSEINPCLLELEITERIAMQNTEEIIEALYELKKLGMKILMDDFGTGYSSLSFLGRLPIDTLKIAREFVEDIKAKSNTAIVSTIVSMAYHLNLSVIAEGVETIEQIEILKNMKCYDMQGYFYSKPIPLHDMEQLLTGNRFLPTYKISM